MFTPITELSESDQAEVLASLDASPKWVATWDIGLADHGDSFSVLPRWGQWDVEGRRPAAFPLGRNQAFRPWRYVSDAKPGHSCPASTISGLDTSGWTLRL
jgi:hypothetical protein